MAGLSMRRWTQVGIGVTAGALTAGAALALPADAPLGPPMAEAATALQRFDDCDEVTAWYVKQALPKVTAWGLDGPPIYYDHAFARDLGGMAIPAAGEVADSAVGSSASGTNVQEQGVDEPDIAKLMGDVLISIHDHQLLVTDVSGLEPELVGTLDLPKGWAYELLVVGDRAILTGTRSFDVRWAGDGLPLGGRVIPYWGYDETSDHSSVTTIDLSDPTAPQVVNRDVVEGSIVTSREHDGTIRIVTTATSRFDFVYPHGQVSKSEARQRNREIVRESAASDWLPWRSFDHRGNGGKPLVDCTDVVHPNDGAGLGTITVMTLDPENPAEFQATAISADGSLVYASPERLYVATLSGGFTGWGILAGDRQEQDDWRHPDTEIHAFSADGDGTTYVASGSVDGVTNDRWAFSEHNGMLRIATSLGSTWSPSESVVTVLREDGASLVPVGKVDGIGVNEEIKAVRWFGDYAVVVTFRQVDPLYLLDLSNASKPTIVGELKVPGFSEYLHPVGGDVILGVGQQGGRGGWGASQVSSFDLADLHRIDMLPFDHMGHTPVAEDSRAFTYLPDQRIALIPTDRWGRNSAKLQIVLVADDGSLTSVRSVPVAGWGNEFRTLPLGGDRIALVSGGKVEAIIAVP